MDPELREYLEAMEQRITTRIDDGDKSLRAEIRAGDEETRRHMDAVGEAIQCDIRVIAEGHQMLTEHIDRRFEEHDRTWDERVQPYETTVKHLVADVAEHERRVVALERREGQ